MTEPSNSTHAPELPESLTWVNRPGPTRLEDLRGSLVILDFWTACCVSCTRVFSTLRALEEEFGEVLNVVGIHTPTFPYERDPRAVEAALGQYEVNHPVATDPERRTARAYGITAWPSLVILDPRGNVAGTRSGEVAPGPVSEALHALADRFDLDPSPQPASRGEPASGLCYPAGVEVSPGGDRVAVSDTAHHRVLLLDRDGNVEETIGTNEPGDATGGFGEARFRRPRGLAFDGPDLIVSDTGNDRVKRIDPSTKSVMNELGPETGEGFLRSPWDLVVDGERIWVALADAHRILAWDPLEQTVDAVLGSGGEGLRDGAHSEASLAQTLGMSRRDDEVFFVDSESCSLRSFHRHQLTVHTFVGQGMHEFGDVDGPAEDARLQHPHDVAAHGEEILVADAYNHKIKRFHVEDDEIRTWLGDGTIGDQAGDRTRLFEPGGVASTGESVFVADTNNHRVLEVEAETGRSRVFAS